MNQRLKLVRKALNLSQDAFADRIGMKGSSVSLLESGRRNITEQVIKSVCREFGVDYMWFTTGEGNMFTESDDDFYEAIDRIMIDENDMRRNLFKSLLNASDEQLQSLSTWIDFCSTLKNN